MSIPWVYPSQSRRWWCNAPPPMAVITGGKNPKKMGRPYRWVQQLKSRQLNVPTYCFIFGRTKNLPTLVSAQVAIYEMTLRFACYVITCRSGVPRNPGKPGSGAHLLETNKYIKYPSCPKNHLGEGDSPSLKYPCKIRLVYEKTLPKAVFSP